MALLTRKRGVGETGSSEAPKHKKRDNERLRSVLKESTFGAAVETLERNIRFRLLPDEDGNARWLALLLHADSIGGLSEKTKRDEAKGSLVQQIISNQIEAIATEEMLDREFFALVPSASTLERMGEYSLLTGAKYYWIVFSSVNGELAFNQNIGPATYQQALAVQNGNSLQAAIESGEDGADIWNRIGSGAAGSEQPSEAVPAAEADDEIFGDAAEPDAEADEFAENAADAEPTEPTEHSAPIEPPEFDPEVDDSDNFYSQLDVSEAAESEPDFDLADEAGEPQFDELAELPADEQGDEDEAPEPVYDEKKSPYTEYLEQNTDREYTEDEVRETVARRFLADDLAFDVDLVELDQAFGRSESPKVNISDVAPTDSSDWLGGQIAHMALSANAELEALHRRHDDELRQTYIDLTARHIQEVVRRVSLSDPENRFGKMMAIATKDRERAVAGSHQTVVQRRQEIDQRFTEEAEAAAEAAAAQARAAYMQTNRGRRESTLSVVEREVVADIETKYESERQQILRVRRADAELSMQQGKTLVHEALADLRREHSDAEARLLESWNARLLEVIVENRKADIARAEALAESLARTNAVEEERRLATERIEALRADQAERVALLEARAQHVQEEAVAELQRVQREFERKLGDEQRRGEESNRAAIELQEQIHNMSESIHDQYKQRLESMQESRDNVAAELTVSNKATARIQRTLVLLMVVLVVAALAIGAIAGWVLAQRGIQIGASGMTELVAAASTAAAIAGL